MIRAALTVAAIIAATSPLHAQQHESPLRPKRESGWHVIGTTKVAIRIIAVVEHEISGEKIPFVVYIVRNDGAPVRLRSTLIASTGNLPERSNGWLPAFEMEKVALLPDDAVLPTGEMLYRVPLQPGELNPWFQILAFDKGPGGRVFWSKRVSELRAEAVPAITKDVLPTYAGRFRTNQGTMLTTMIYQGHLLGTSQTVGPKPDHASPYDFITDRSGLLVAEKFDPLRKGSLGTLLLRPWRANNLGGYFTSGKSDRQPFVTCRIAESDSDFANPRLRAGSLFWAELKRVVAKPAAGGKVQVDATFKLWSVRDVPERFEVRYATQDGETGLSLSPVRDARGTADQQIEPCGTREVTYRATAAAKDLQQLISPGGPDYSAAMAPWDISAVVNAAEAESGSEPDGSSSTSAPPPAPSSDGPIRITPPASAPVQLGRYSNYGIWDFKLEELAPGPDGHWQAVVRVRDAAIYRVGLAQDGVILTLFDEDGRSVASNGILYRASVTGSRQQLESIPQTMWMEKGDEIRVRLSVPKSAGFQPVRVRLGSGDRETLSRTFDFPRD